MNYLTSSGELTSSQAVLAAPGAIAVVSVTADGTNAADVIVYDNPSAASGTVLAHVKVKATDVFDMLHLTVPAVANNGIYVSISGTGAKAVIHYLRG